jgi:hypothetical protein
MSDPQDLYLALDPATRTGATITAQRVYRDATHAQLANPAGCLYTVEAVGGEDRYRPDVKVDACRDSLYPITLQEMRVIGHGAQAEGAWVLLDLGPRKDLRWCVAFRNDQTGGRGNSEYCNSPAEAMAAFQAKVEFEAGRWQAVADYRAHAAA